MIDTGFEINIASNLEADASGKDQEREMQSI